MPANITLKNAAAANVTFNGFSESSEAVEWTESGATSLLGTTRLKLTRKMPTNRANGVLRTISALTVPKIDGTTGALVGQTTIRTEISHTANVTATEVAEACARNAAAQALAAFQQTAKDGALPG